jgi:hypothetical protein
MADASGQFAGSYGVAMNDLDPTQVTSREALAKCLQRLHMLADRPSYRTLEERTKNVSGFLPGTSLPRIPLKRATITDVLTGRKFPRKAFLLTFVEACGVDLEVDPMRNTPKSGANGRGIRIPPTPPNVAERHTSRQKWMSSVHDGDA